MLAALSPLACTAPPDDGYHGYIEGEYTYVSAPFAGYLAELKVARGQPVTAGQLLFVLDAEPQAHTLAEAEAVAQAARAEADNLLDTRRAEEIAGLRAEVNAADAAVELARSRLQRERDLVQREFVSQARLDELQSQLEQATAQRAQARAQLALARDPLGRHDEYRAADAGYRAAQARVAQQRWLFARREATAPLAGELVDTYFRPGEWVPAGQPVASILPPAGRRVRFFVPETELARLQPGVRVSVRCDGCQAPLTAIIDYVSPTAEYTPPVIYSRGSRERLVFRVEAVPQGGDGRLPPGLPVDVMRSDR
ncbi:MAG: HlyD family efflux transporter periplasmic adaptor subunit [Rhodocyclaceae bacterium]|nr:HlyD family efflux transporter periplasmic adaptor subunit [Rhodocyclaceae bacterium]